MKTTYSGAQRIVAIAAVALAAGLPHSSSATQLVVEHFAQAVADNSPIGTATGWTAWSVTNGVLQDFSALTPGANYPSMSRAANGGFGGVTGNTVLAVNNFSTPSLLWTNTATVLHDCVVTNVVFYTKNNSALSTEQVAICVGGQWYASTQLFKDGGGNSVWAVNTFNFTTNAAAWQSLNTNNLTLGATNTSPLPAGDIQAIGVYGSALGASGNKIRLDEFIVNGSLPSGPQVATPTAAPAANVTAPTTVTLSVTVTGTPPFSYHWRKGAGDLADGPTGTGSTLTGATSSQLVITTTSTADSGNYDVVVTNNYGAVTSAAIAVNVTAAGVPPGIASIVTTPANGISEVGGAAMGIQVTASGTGPFTYQWRKSGTDLTSETNATLSLASAYSNAGSYAVVVSSAYGSITSTPPTTLTVVDTTAPVIAFPLGNPTNIIVKTPFTPSYLVTDNSGATPNLVITGSVNTNVAGTYTLHFVVNDASNNVSQADLVVNVLLINEHFNETVADNLAVSNAPGWHALAVAIANSTVTDYTGIGGNGNFPTISQNPTAPDALGGTGFLVMGEALNATPSLVWKDTTALLQDQQITNVTFFSRNNSAGSEMRLAIRVFTNWYVSTTAITDASGGAVPWIAQSAPISYDASAWQQLDVATLTLGSPATETLTNYAVSGFGFYGVMPAGKIRIDELKASGTSFTYPATPPSVQSLTVAPTNRVDGTAWTGTPLTFQATASGSVPLTYLWRKNGNIISAGGSSSFNIASPVVADSGNYDVVVTNSSGISATSVVVSVTVSPAKILVNQHFSLSTNDPGVIGQMPGWHALAYDLTNSVVTDYTFTPNPPLSINHPNLSRGAGSDGSLGYVVLGQGDAVEPVLVWMDTPASVQSGSITNVLFSSRNALPSSTMQVAVQIGGQWYVSTTQLIDTTLGVVGTWAVQNFMFTRDAGAWQELDIATLALGNATVAPLPAQPITGIGVYGMTHGVTTARIRIDEFMVDGFSSAAPQPTIQPVYQDGSGNLVVRTATVSGSSYVLEATPSLQSPITWTPVLTNAGTGGVLTNLVPTTTPASQFFRYRVQ